MHFSAFFAFLCLHFFWHPAEGIWCYQCTNIPSNSQYYDGCADISPGNSTAHLSVDCSTMPVPTNSIKNTPNNFLGIESSSLAMSLATNYSLDDSRSSNSIDWLCVKINAVAGGQSVVARGCVWALTQDMVDRCESVAKDSSYTIGNLTIAKVVMCFCDKNNCNAATNPFLSTLLLILSSMLIKCNYF